MLLSTITVKHPNSFVLLKPKSRDKQNHVRDWNVLNTAKKYDDILRIAEYYRSEGISNAVILHDKNGVGYYRARVNRLFRSREEAVASLEQEGLR